MQLGEPHRHIARCKIPVVVTGLVDAELEYRLPQNNRIDFDLAREKRHRLHADVERLHVNKLAVHAGWARQRDVFERNTENRKKREIGGTRDDEISTGPCLDLLADFLTDQSARRIDEKIRNASAGDENDEQKEIDDAKQQTTTATRRLRARTLSRPRTERCAFKAWPVSRERRR